MYTKEEKEFFSNNENYIQETLNCKSILEKKEVDLKYLNEFRRLKKQKKEDLINSKNIILKKEKFLDNSIERINFTKNLLTTNLDNLDNQQAQLLGKRVFDRGFKEFFLFWFPKITGNEFLYEKAFHDVIFDYWNNIYNLNDDYILSCLSIAPRSCKTTTAIYFFIYIILTVPNSESMYVSFNKNIISQAVQMIKFICENESFKKCYPQLGFDEMPNYDYSTEFDEEDETPEIRKKKNLYNLNRITIGKARINFAVAGGGITGLGAGIITSEKPNTCNGLIIVDDPNKPLDIINSPIKTDTVYRNFIETIMSRRNSKKYTPVSVVMQRLGKQDLVGRLLDDESISGQKIFTFIKNPLLDENGVCKMPRMYDEKAINMAKSKPFSWHAQYMQEPISPEFNPLKSEWFRYYTDLPKDVDIFYICCDTAFKEDSKNDDSVFGLFGISQNKLYLVDMMIGKWDMPNLKENLKNFYLKWTEILKSYCNGYIDNVYIEDKGSGTSLIQELKLLDMPISGIKPTAKVADGENEVLTNKYNRAMEVQSILKNGKVYLNVNGVYLQKLLKQIDNFNGQRGNSDDLVDVIIYSIKKYIAFIGLVEAMKKEDEIEEDNEDFSDVADFLDNNFGMDFIYGY